MRPLDAHLVVACTPAELFHWVEDLGRYPRWMDLVRQATPLPQEPGSMPAAGSLSRWAVVLSAAVGPLRRSKRLTMARTRHEPVQNTSGTTTQLARFERQEPDGRAHATWVLEARVTPHSEGSELTMTLSYDGRWWGPLIEGLLAEQINRARPRLSALATGAAD